MKLCEGPPDNSKTTKAPTCSTATTRRGRTRSACEMLLESRTFARSGQGRGGRLRESPLVRNRQRIRPSRIPRDPAGSHPDGEKERNGDQGQPGGVGDASRLTFYHGLGSRSGNCTMQAVTRVREIAAAVDENRPTLPGRGLGQLRTPGRRPGDAKVAKVLVALTPLPEVFDEAENLGRGFSPVPPPPDLR